jgi:hypothetical protein
MNRPQLGQLVEINAYAETEWITNDIAHLGTDYVEEYIGQWKRTPFSGIGVYIGYRHVYNKHHKLVTWVDNVYDGVQRDRKHVDYNYSRPIELWLIAIDERKNPVYVHPNDVVFCEDNQS